MKTVIFAEVLGQGFNGGTDETDGRVFWIAAPSMDDVNTALADIPHAGLSEMTAAEVGALSNVDFALPDQRDQLRAALLACSPLDALTAAESFISGFEGDDMQEGIDELLAKVRAAIDQLKQAAEK